MNLQQLRKLADQKLAELEHAKRAVTDEKRALVEAKRHQEDSAEAQKIVQEVAEAVQNRVHQQISSVVTRCLKSVFGPDAYNFRIDFRQSRGRTEARLLFLREGQEVNPTLASGGSTVGVAAFALRLSSLLLARPRKRRFLALDEPFGALDKEAIVQVRELLLALAQEFQTQLVIVTHNDDLKLGRVIDLEG